MASVSRDHISAVTSVTAVEEKRKIRNIKQRNILELSLQVTANKTCNWKSNRNIEKINIKDNVTQSDRQFNHGFVCPVKLKLDTTNWKTNFKMSYQRPKVYTLPKLNFTNFTRNCLLARQELLKDKILTRELATRLAKAKLSLTSTDSDQTTASLDTTKHKPNLTQPPTRVSFLSVSRQVANILRFRQSTLHKKSGIVDHKEMSTLESDKLPQTPRFSSYMSPAAQYALMKGYEDIIIDKLSTKYPECTGMLKRNRTPHHSVVIVDRTKSSEHNSTTCGFNNSFLEAEESEHFENSLNEKKSETREASTETEIRNFVETFPEVKVIPSISKGRNSEETNKLLTNIPSSELSSSEAMLHLNTSSASRISTMLPLNTSSASRISTILPPLVKGNEKIGIMHVSEHRGTSPQYSSDLVHMDTHDPVRREKRIQLSYHMEQAMDILDTMKTKSEQALSPRVKITSGRQITPLSHFNRWTNRWANEFNTDIVK